MIYIHKVLCLKANMGNIIPTQIRYEGPRTGTLNVRSGLKEKILAKLDVLHGTIQSILSGTMKTDRMSHDACSSCDLDE